MGVPAQQAELSRSPSAHEMVNSCRSHRRHTLHHLADLKQPVLDTQPIQEPQEKNPWRKKRKEKPASNI